MMSPLLEKRFLVPVLGALSLSAPRATAQETGSPDVARRIDRLERENEQLRLRLDALAGDLERVQLGDVFPTAEGSRLGMGPAASKVYRQQDGPSIGGYGEAIFQSPSGPGRATADFLRAITYLGYRFDDRWVFNSELEVEHANTDAHGEVELEFAYLEYMHSDALNVRGGLLLVPMGWLNEMHEPTTFGSANRTQTERRILPTTWSENAVGLAGETEDWSYKAYVMAGLDASGFSSSGIRGGRQKGSKSVAEDLAFVGRLDWSGAPGATVGASAYVGDSGQDGAGLPSVGTTLFDLHAQLEWRGWRGRILHARGELDDVADLNGALGLTGADSIGESLEGTYVELGYDLMDVFSPGSKASLTAFVRYETLDTQADVPAGFSADPANDDEIVTVGLAFQPIDRIVIKLDYEDWDDDPDRWNLAMGYVF